MTDMKAKYLKLAREQELMFNEAQGETEMKDPTEKLRRDMIANGQPQRDLEHAEQRWNAMELAKDFTVQSFMAPFVFVTRKSDGAQGTMEFTHSPRYYFNFKEDK